MASNSDKADYTEVTMTQIATLPLVTGPVTGGSKGWPFGASMLDVAAFGYTEAEYLLEGTAVRYQIRTLGSSRLIRSDTKGRRDRLPER